MRTTIIYLLFLFQVFIGLGQINDPNWKNLVPNYSFEVVEDDFPLCEGGNSYSTPPYDCLEEYWSGVYEWTHPLRRNALCNFWHGIPVGSANVLPDNPRSGERRGHGSEGEYLVVPLWHGGLSVGRKYFIETFSRNGGGEKMYFSNGQPRQCGGNEIIAQSGGILAGGFVANNGSSDWNRTRTYFSSPFNLDWMSLGISGDAGDGTGGASWDDLRIYEVQNNKCRDNWYFDNTVFNYPVEVFQASNNIYVGNGVDPENGINHIPGDVIQYANTEVILRAGNQVIIDQGTFSQQSGAKLLVIENTPCGDDLCPEELAFENEILCNQSSAVIGTEGNDWGTSVQWSPSTYLDNPNISNPTFTSPGGVGAITYEVEVTYTCDASEIKPTPGQPFSFSNSYTVTHEVVVQYTNLTDPTATITANVIQDDAYNFEADLNFSEGVTEFTIEVTSIPGFTPEYSETFYLGEDFSCCSYNWNLPLAFLWASCIDDLITITAKNKCSGEETILELPWNKSEVPFTMPSSYPNVITANNDGSNDDLCFDIESADYYEIVVLNRWGNVIAEQSGIVTESPFCINIPQLEDVVDGTYSYLITFGDNCGNEDFNYQFFQVFGTKNNNNSAQLKNHDEIESPKEYVQKNIALSPNPTTSELNIVGPIEVTEVEIIDANGGFVMKSEVRKNQVNVKHIKPGTYYCKIKANGMIITKKFVKL